jgi:histidinol-phosphate aminotransferase
VPYSNDGEDLPALIAKAAETDAKLIYFANPDNPMGSYVPGTEIAAALDALPQGTLLVLDEAYGELAPEDALTGLPMDDPRLIRMRTFSKGYGMAGARIGYAMGHPDLITAFDKVRNHFGLNRAAQAGALAALGDTDWLCHIRAEVATSRAALARIGAAHGLTALPSATNFVALDTHRDGTFARALVAGFAAEGIFIRMPFVAPQDRCIRISCGPARDMALFEEALPRALAHAEASLTATA